MENLNEHTLEFQQFMTRLLGKPFPWSGSSQIFQVLDKLDNRLKNLQLTKWKGLKNLRPEARNRKMYSDISKLMHEFVPNIDDGVDAFDWSINDTQKDIDLLPFKLPYLSTTSYYDYVSSFDGLINTMPKAKRTDIVIGLLKQVRNHSDAVAIGQFYSTQMVHNFKFMNKSRIRIDRRTIWKYLRIYHEMYGIYEKDICFCNCLINQANNRTSPTYDEARRKRFDTHLQSVSNALPIFKKPYDNVLRNAKAHTDIEIDSVDHCIQVFKNGRPNGKRSYEQIVSATEEMSAFISVVRLIPYIVSLNNWRVMKQMLS